MIVQKINPYLFTQMMKIMMKNQILTNPLKLGRMNLNKVRRLILQAYWKPLFQLTTYLTITRSIGFQNYSIMKCH